jgi:hypothetical protein
MPAGRELSDSSSCDLRLETDGHGQAGTDRHAQTCRRGLELHKTLQLLLVVLRWL